MTARRNTFRVIGGQWRSRRLSFPEQPGLRPTPDRVRETVFNWLMPVIEGSRCLDLYAGSGALGLEALSRGARTVTFVDESADVMAQLKQNLQLLNVDTARLVQMDVRNFLSQTADVVDIVFADAPYHRGLLSETFSLLDTNAWLASESWVYFEHARDEEMPSLPESWKLLKSKTAGQVAYHLARCG